MYNHFADKIKYVNVTIPFHEPQWIDREDKSLEQEELAFGCKVTYNILRPDMIYVMDEVDSDTLVRKVMER